MTLALVGVAFVLRAWSNQVGLPFAVGVDEPAIIDRALRILNTNDWHPHFFFYPSLAIYGHTLVALGRYLLGVVQGEWNSLATLDIAAVYTAGRVATAAVGAWTVWLVYRLGAEIESPWAGVVAAAQLSVYSMHVRESHFALTDVPVTALTTLAVWLACRAARVRSVRAYGLAGLAVGLAASTKYNGGIAAVAVLAVWLVHEWSADDRRAKAGAALGAMLAGFIVASPYAVIDLTGFLNGFGDQIGRFSPRNRIGGVQSWWAYLKHLAGPSSLWLPMAAAGAVAVAVRVADLRRWLPVLAFAASYYYVLASHPIIYGRYALPLVPLLCLLAAVPIVRAPRWVARWRPSPPKLGPAVASVPLLVLLATMGMGTVVWLGDLDRPDTRVLASRWLRASAASGAVLAVEASGPQYLATLGFRVVSTERLVDVSVASLARQRVDYVVLSSDNPDGNRPFLDRGRVVMTVLPTADRTGPPIRIVHLDPEQ